MAAILRGLVLLATAGALSFPTNLTAPAVGSGKSASRRRAVTAPAPARANFDVSQLEYYLGDDGIAYIRPGVKVIVNSITDVAPGKKPVVDFNLTDNFDQPLDRNGKITPGPIAPGFILSQWNPETRFFHTLTTRTRNGITNPSADQGGTYTDLELGHYKYTFGTALPANFDVTKTTTLGVYARRTLTDIIGKNYNADNVIKDFVPAGGTPAQTWAVMSAASTCNNCHDPLALHGGTRREVKLCVMCHNNEVQTDTTSGQPFTAKVFFHRIHMGENLPSVKAGGTFYAGGDFSTVAYPQDIRNCQTCHEAKAKENDVWMTHPTAATCGSCHDDVNFTTGANHPGGAQPDDACAKCHIPDSGQEYDASVKGAHTVPYKSKQLKGLTATISNVTNLAAGKKPTVSYILKNGDGSAVDGTKLTTFSPMIAGPTTSYSQYYRENGLKTAVFDAATGTTTYTFTNAVPADATGTWTVSGDFYRTINLKRADGKADISYREAAMNPIKYYSLTGGTATARRTVVVTSQCNACHERLALHGTQRLTTEECVICHNPVNNDASQRPASENPPESISFQRLIHRIHRGEELTQDFTIYGFGGSRNNFNEVRFPGDLRNCAKCHTGGSYRLPVPVGAASVTTLRDYFSPQGPGTASCLGCHDNRDAAAHAYLNTTTFGGSSAEACATCHGANSEWSADKVHAR